MTAPSAVHVRDTIRAILRDHPIYMNIEEIGARLSADQGLNLDPHQIYQHCHALHFHGYLHKLQPDADHPSRFAFIPAEHASPHRRATETVEQREFEALAQLAGDPGPTR